MNPDDEDVNPLVEHFREHVEANRRAMEMLGHPRRWTPERVRTLISDVEWPDGGPAPRVVLTVSPHAPYNVVLDREAYLEWERLDDADRDPWLAGHLNANRVPVPS